MTEYVSIPLDLLLELREGLAKIEEILATVEELSDKEGLADVKEAEAEYRRGEFVTAKSGDEIRKMIE